MDERKQQRQDELQGGLAAAGALRAPLAFCAYVYIDSAGDLATVNFSEGMDGCSVELGAALDLGEYSYSLILSVPEHLVARGGTSDPAVCALGQVRAESAALLPRLHFATHGNAGGFTRYAFVLLDASGLEVALADWNSKQYDLRVEVLR